MLITNIDLSLEETFEGVNELGGLVIPAHVERRAYGLLAVLGFTPLPFEALEISHHLTVNEACRYFPEIKNFPVVQSGDVHYRDGFLGMMQFEMEAPTVNEIRKALRGVGDRAMYIRAVR